MAVSITRRSPCATGSATVEFVQPYCFNQRVDSALRVSQPACWQQHAAAEAAARQQLAEGTARRWRRLRGRRLFRGCQDSLTKHREFPLVLQNFCALNLSLPRHCFV